MAVLGPMDEADGDHTLTADEIKLMRRSMFTLIVRGNDGQTCYVNELKCSRTHEIFAEQDKTSIGMACTEIWKSFATLMAVPEQYRREMAAMLASRRNDTP